MLVFHNPLLYIWSTQYITTKDINKDHGEDNQKNILDETSNSESEYAKCNQKCKEIIDLGFYEEFFFQTMRYFFFKKVNISLVLHFS